MQLSRFDRPQSSPLGSTTKKVVLGLGIVAIIFFLKWSKADNPVDSNDDSRISIRIEQGMSASAVADLLEEKRLIRSSWKFGWVASRTGQAGKIQAGSYVLQPSQSLQEILAAITGGQKGEVVVTIPEGFTVKDIDALLAKMNLLKEGDIINCANTCAFPAINFIPATTRGLAERGGRVEGYLYPDTYFVDPGSFDAEDFLTRMLKTFESRVIGKYDIDVEKKNEGKGDSLHEIVTMASLIEEETRKADERPVVSGILWKRFQNSIGLQVDATVRYIIDKPTATITAKDLQTDSPYNTRKYRGLPPGPIASPSLSSIEAALHPEESPYLYYLHGSDGQIHYGRTNDEHNENRAKYL